MGGCDSCTVIVRVFFLPGSSDFYCFLGGGKGGEGGREKKRGGKIRGFVCIMERREGGQRFCGQQQAAGVPGKGLSLASLTLAKQCRAICVTVSDCKHRTAQTTGGWALHCFLGWARQPQPGHLHLRWREDAMAVRVTLWWCVCPAASGSGAYISYLRSPVPGRSPAGRAVSLPSPITPSVRRRVPCTLLTPTGSRPSGLLILVHLHISLCLVRPDAP